MKPFRFSARSSFILSKVTKSVRFIFQKLVPSTQNPEMLGDKYLVSDRGVLTYHGDMYLTTTQKDHRAFTK